jgi:hypothetical protein
VIVLDRQLLFCLNYLNIQGENERKGISEGIKGGSYMIFGRSRVDNKTKFDNISLRNPYECRLHGFAISKPLFPKWGQA